LSEVKEKLNVINLAVESFSENKDSESLGKKLDAGLENIEEVKSISSRMSEDLEVLKNTVSDLFDVLGNPEDQEENAELKNLNSAIERVENLINSADKTNENRIDELKQASKEISGRIAALSNTLSSELSAEISGNISETSKQIQEKLDKLLELANIIESKQKATALMK
jgi:predicted  nucleic acid-binding Zn-ribbon protein